VKFGTGAWHGGAEFYGGQHESEGLNEKRSLAVMWKEVDVAERFHHRCPFVSLVVSTGKESLSPCFLHLLPPALVTRSHSLPLTQNANPQIIPSACSGLPMWAPCCMYIVIFTAAVTALNSSSSRTSNPDSITMLT
jgi:hypothetical protein